MSNGFTSFFSKIFAGLLALILSIFTPAQPITSPGKSATSQRNYFFNTLGDEQGVAITITKAIKNNDVETIYNMFNETRKEEFPDLKEKINKLFTFVEGDIVNEEIVPDGGGRTDANFGIITYQAVNPGRIFYTDAGKKYIIAIGYIIVDVHEPKNVGITDIRLAVYENDNSYHPIYDIIKGVM